LLSGAVVTKQERGAKVEAPKMPEKIKIVLASAMVLRLFLLDYIKKKSSNEIINIENNVKL
jgi:hypothetical protein